MPSSDDDKTNAEKRGAAKIAEIKRAVREGPVGQPPPEPPAPKIPSTAGDGDAQLARRRPT